MYIKNHQSKIPLKRVFNNSQLLLISLLSNQFIILSQKNAKVFNINKCINLKFKLTSKSNYYANCCTFFKLNFSYMLQF